MCTRWWLRWLAGCIGFALVVASSPGPLSAAGPKILTVVQSGDASTLDPPHEGFNSGSAVDRSLYEGLVAFDVRMKPIPVLAQSWSISPDGLTYTIHLQPGVTFHDGTPFNAQAAKVNLDRLRDPKEDPRYALFDMISQVKVVDDTTVQLILSRPFSALFYNFANPDITMVSPAAMAKYGIDGLATHEDGTGPFTLVSWTKGDNLVVRRNPRYWKPGQPYVDQIVFRDVPDGTQRVAMLKTGEAQFVFPIDPAGVKPLSGDPSIRLIKGPSILVQFVGMNLLHPPFNNRDVRLALNYAIDKQTLINTLYQGYAQEMHSFVSPLLPGYKAVGSYPFDLNKARELLREAGYPNGFTATLWISNVTFQQRLAVFLQQQFAQIGVTLKIVALDGGSLYALENKGPGENTVQMRISGFSPSNGSTYWQFHVVLSKAAWPPNGLSNFSFYENPAMEQALDAALRTTNLAQQNAGYAQAQQMEFDDGAVIWLASPTNIAGQTTNLTGAYVVPDQTLTVQSAQLH
ncbi:MAG TPA: ABC transporter substrate-binding protein [bacterium]|nr:ABC transporter substrate-binding protein [bacterium]